MSDLILDSLEIQNFRAFRHLQVAKLGRVNLFVGKNNVGKSSLLEALWLYARRGATSFIWRILEARNESRRSDRYVSDLPETESRLTALRYLFHGRKNIEEQHEPIRIGPTDANDEQLVISMGYVKSASQQQLEFFDESEYLPSYTNLANLRLSVAFHDDKIEYSMSRTGRMFNMESALERLSIPNIHSVFVPANGLQLVEIGQLWDSVALTDQEQDVITALRIIAPEVERVSLIGSSERLPERTSAQQRIPIVKITGFDTPIPLRSLGEGMNRMFVLALALANAKDGMLLIDEIESGLHYSVQPDMWRLIFEMAHRLNVQVFSTTHSWDCITAFQQAAREDEHEEGLLIRLERRNDDVRTTLFNEEELEIVAREQIEVR